MSAPDEEVDEIIEEIQSMPYDSDKDSDIAELQGANE